MNAQFTSNLALSYTIDGKEVKVFQLVNERGFAVADCQTVDGEVTSYNCAEQYSKAGTTWLASLGVEIKNN